MRTLAIDVPASDLVGHDNDVIRVVKASAARLFAELAAKGLGPDGITIRIETDKATEGSIEISSILSGRTKRGRVNVNLEGAHVQLDIAKARVVYHMLGEAIEAAISDEVVYTWLREELGLDDERASIALHRFRELRQGTPGAKAPH